MRFIGNKENLLDKIYQVMQEKGIEGDSFFDVFSGTASVGKYFKKLNYQVFTSDLLYFSYVLQRAYITNNTDVQFKKLLRTIDSKNKLASTPALLRVVAFLNGVKPVKGFVHKNYAPTATSHLPQPRMYFSDENAQIIDAIRQTIEMWKTARLITANEYFVLLACLIETVPFFSNITGVYGAFQKKWDVRATKKLLLRPVELVINDKQNFSFNEDSARLAKRVKADIYYLDPPYNQRQYAPNYHVLETIALYDNPKISGVTGMRDYSAQKSAFCNEKRGLDALDEMARLAHCKSLILSYNTEGIMRQKDIIATLKKYGAVELVEFQYLRYKSNNGGMAKNKKFIGEQLYVLKKI